MTEETAGSPSLIRLGKLANARDFDKLEELWPDALDNREYTWRELIPVAGQVGRQNAVPRAAALMTSLIDWVAENRDDATALLAAREAARQLPKAPDLRSNLRARYLRCHPDFDQLPGLLDLLLPDEGDLAAAVALIDRYVELQPGAFAVDRSFLVPGLVEALDGDNGRVNVLFQDRRAEYGPDTLGKLTPRPADDFGAMMLYAADRLREIAAADPVEFVKLALRSSREGRVMYKELKGHIVALLGEKGWKDWWAGAKPALKRDPMLGMSEGSQPSFRLLRQADRWQDRVRREFDFAKTPQDKLQKVLQHLDEIARDEKNGGESQVDDDLLVHLGNGAAKVAVAVLNESPALALAGLALHAEIAGRGAAVARPNPRAAAQVLGRIPDPGTLCADLPEALLTRVLNYLRASLPDTWGQVWGAVLLRAGRRQSDSITRELIEAGQTEALAVALDRAVERPTSSPELLGWLWRALHGGGAATQFLAGREELAVPRVADAMFSLLDSAGKLYGMSLEEKHLKALESARSSLATQNNRPLLRLLDEADRKEAQRLKRLFETNAGLSPAQRTQLLGYLRSRYADIFVEITREWEDGAVIYTTEQGLRTTQSALNHIIEVEIPEVARQIGEAAAHGDLSENSEYTAALEKRDQLASRATRLESELSAAKVINHEMSGSDFVNVGTRVTVTPAAGGEDEVYTFLGPWDSDVEQRILNYQAPLALSFMGARVGDTVTFGEGDEARSWIVKAIEPGI